MSVPPPIEAALKRLAAALDHFEAATERQSQAQSARGDVEEEFAIMRDDRSRLAVELDGAQAKLRRMEAAHDEAMKRIDRASEAILGALGEEDAVDADDASGSKES